MIDRFIKYTLRFEYQVQGRYFIKDGYEIYRPNEKDVDAFTTVFIFPLEAPPLCDQQGFLKYLRTQLDKLYKPYGLSQAKELGAIAYTENMYSRIEPIRWQDLTEAERLEHLGNLEAGLYDEAQTVIKRAVNVFRKIQELDSGAPDPLLVSQTPAPDTATKNAAQPPVVDADAEQTDPAAQTPGASRQAGKKPRAGADSSEQSKRKKASDEEIRGAMKLLKDKAEKTNSKDWEKGTIILFLKEKGFDLELSKKTKIGKYWAILYEKKIGSPPSHWYYSDIQQAQQDLLKAGISLDWLL